MSGYQLTTDLIEDALFRGGEPIDGSSDFADDIVKWMDRGYQAIAASTFEATPDIRAPWWWLWSANPGVITLVPNIGLGNVNPPTGMVTRNSNNVTLSAIPTDVDGNQISVQGWYIKFQATGASSVSIDVYKVLSHNIGDHVIVLDSPYTGPTVAAVNVNIFSIEYDLPADLMYIIAPLRTYASGRERCEIVSKSSLEGMFPLTQITYGIPQQAAFIAEQRLRVSSYIGQGSDTHYARLDFDYVRIPPPLTASLSEEPLIPLRFRPILADYALQQLYLVKNDDRASGIGELLKNRMVAMYKAHLDNMNRGSNSFARIYPRQQDRASMRGPWRTESGYILGY